MYRTGLRLSIRHSEKINPAPAYPAKMPWTKGDLLTSAFALSFGGQVCDLYGSFASLTSPA